ncbi:MAG: hypothetical protein ABUK01_16225 [Leptospirales bacterium]
MVSVALTVIVIRASHALTTIVQILPEADAEAIANAVTQARDATIISAPMPRTADAEVTQSARAVLAHLASVNNILTKARQDIAK